MSVDLDGLPFDDSPSGNATKLPDVPHPRAMPCPYCHRATSRVVNPGGDAYWCRNPRCVSFGLYVTPKDV